MVAPKIVATADIEPSETLSEVQTIVATFHDFSNLPYAPINGSLEGDYVESPEILCHGYQWKVRLVKSARNPYIGIHLRRVRNEPNRRSRENVQTTFSIRVGRETRTIQKTLRSGMQAGWDNFLYRSEVVASTNGYLQEDGTLKIEGTFRSLKIP